VRVSVPVRDSVQMNGSRKVVGVLRGYDPFMNLVLDDAVEVVSATERNSLGMIVRTRPPPLLAPLHTRVPTTAEVGGWGWCPGGPGQLGGADGDAGLCAAVMSRSWPLEGRWLREGRCRRGGLCTLADKDRAQFKHSVAGPLYGGGAMTRERGMCKGGARGYGPRLPPSSS
jgi:hypothetical protein